MNSFKEVWEAIDAGKTVCWEHEGYQVFVEPDLMPERTKELNFRQDAERNGSILAVRFISNYFGSILEESQLSSLFIKGESNEV